MKSEWKTYTVQELINKRMLEPPMDGNHGENHPKVSDYVKNGVPFIMANNLVNGKVDYINCAFITEKQARTLKKDLHILVMSCSHIKRQLEELQL